MTINTGNSKSKIYIGNTKVSKIYLGSRKIYSSGSTCTYICDGNTYQEEIDEGASCLSPKTFTPAKNGWEFAGWRQDTAANGNVLSNLTMGNEPITLHAVFKQVITVTYYDGSTSARQWSKERYYNTNNVENPTFILTQKAISGWTARGWSTSTAGNGGISYSNGAAFTRDSNVTLYGLYYQTITLTYYNGSTSAASTSGTRYYNPGSGGIVNPTFTLTPATLSGWTFRGWATSSGATAGIAYNSISGTAFAASTTVYAAYSQAITLSYSGNGATGGSTAVQTSTRYWNTGNVSNPSFTLRSNGFSQSGYTFSKWALGSASGTQYAAGANVTLSASTTMYAVWIFNPFSPIVLGVLQSGNYTSASRINVETFGGYDLPAQYVSTTTYGHYGHNAGEKTEQGATITFNSRGLSTVKITPFALYSQGHLTVIADGVTLYDANVVSGETYTINVSGRSAITVKATAKTGESGEWYAGGIQTITCS